MFHNFVFIIGNWKISAELKECALQLWELGYKPDFILESLCISNVSMYRWHNCQLATLSIAHKTKIIVYAVLTAIKEVYCNEVDAYLGKLAWWLDIHNDTAILCSLQARRLPRVLCSLNNPLQISCATR